MYKNPMEMPRKWMNPDHKRRGHRIRQPRYLVQMTVARGPIEVALAKKLIAEEYQMSVCWWVKSKRLIWYNLATQTSCWEYMRKSISIDPQTSRATQRGCLIHIIPLVIPSLGAEHRQCMDQMGQRIGFIIRK
jgi:hypothetical protein